MSDMYQSTVQYRVISAAVVLCCKSKVRGRAVSHTPVVRYSEQSSSLIGLCVNIHLNRGMGLSAYLKYD